MEKHIEIFCKQNPKSTIICPCCEKKLEIKTKDFLKTKNIYKGHCNYCDNDFTYDTKDMFKKLEPLKKFC